MLHVYFLWCRIDAHFVIKITDFGLSEDVYARNYFRQGQGSSVKLPVKWMAPESLQDGDLLWQDWCGQCATTIWEGSFLRVKSIRPPTGHYKPALNIVLASAVHLRPDCHCCFPNHDTLGLLIFCSIVEVTEHAQCMLVTNNKSMLPADNGQTAE